MPPQVAARMNTEAVATKSKTTTGSNKSNKVGKSHATPATVTSSSSAAAERLGAHGAKVKHKRRFCRIEGCERIVKSQGLCQRHGAKPRLCKVKGCVKQAQGNFDGMCKSHFKEHKRRTTPIPKVEAAPAPPHPTGFSVFDNILPSSVDYFPAHAKVRGKMPLVAHLAEGFHGGKPPAWHRNEERKARGLLPIQNPATQLEGWERELVWMEILVLTGVPEVSFRHLARAWGRDKGFHMVLAQFICERHGDVQRKKRKRDEEIIPDSNSNRKNNSVQQQKKTAPAPLEPPKRVLALPPAPTIMQQEPQQQQQQQQELRTKSNMSPAEKNRVRGALLSPERKQQLATFLIRRKSSGTAAEDGSTSLADLTDEQLASIGADVWDDSTSYGDLNYNEAMAADLFNLTQEESAILKKRLSIGRRTGGADDDSSSIYSRSVASGKTTLISRASSKDGQQQQDRLTKRDSSASLRSNTSSVQIPNTVAVKKAPPEAEHGGGVGGGVVDSSFQSIDAHKGQLQCQRNNHNQQQQQQQQQQYNGQAVQPAMGSPLQNQNGNPPHQQPQPNSHGYQLETAGVVQNYHLETAGGVQNYQLQQPTIQAQDQDHALTGLQGHNAQQKASNSDNSEGQFEDAEPKYSYNHQDFRSLPSPSPVGETQLSQTQQQQQYVAGGPDQAQHVYQPPGPAPPPALPYQQPVQAPAPSQVPLAPPIPPAYAQAQQYPQQSYQAPAPLPPPTIAPAPTQKYQAPAPSPPIVPTQNYQAPALSPPIAPTQNYQAPAPPPAIAPAPTQNYQAPAAPQPIAPEPTQNYQQPMQAQQVYQHQAPAAPAPPAGLPPPAPAQQYQPQQQQQLQVPVYQQPAPAPPAIPAPAPAPVPVPVPATGQQYQPQQQQQQQFQHTHQSHQHVQAQGLSNHQRQHSQQGLNLQGEAFHQQQQQQQQQHSQLTAQAPGQGQAQLQPNPQGHPFLRGQEQQHPQSLHQRQNSHQDLSLHGVPQVTYYPPKTANQGGHPNSPPAQGFHHRQHSQQMHGQAQVLYSLQPNQQSGQAQSPGLSYQNSGAQSTQQVPGTQPQPMQQQQVGANHSQQFRGSYGGQQNPSNQQYQHVDGQTTSPGGTQSTQQVYRQGPTQNCEKPRSTFQKQSSSQDLHDYDHRNEHLQAQEDDHMDVDPSHEHHDYGAEIEHEDHDHHDTQQPSSSRHLPNSQNSGSNQRMQGDNHSRLSSGPRYGYQHPSEPKVEQPTQMEGGTHQYGHQQQTNLLPVAAPYEGNHTQVQEHHHQHDHLGQSHYLELPRLSQQTSYAGQGGAEQSESSSHYQVQAQQQQVQPHQQQIERATQYDGSVQQAQSNVQAHSYQQRGEPATYQHQQQPELYPNQQQQQQGIPSTGYQSPPNASGGHQVPYQAQQQPQLAQQSGYQHLQPPQPQPAQGQQQQQPVQEDGQYQNHNQQPTSSQQGHEVAQDMLTAFHNEVPTVHYHHQQQQQQQHGAQPTGHTPFQQPIMQQNTQPPVATYASQAAPAGQEQQPQETVQAPAAAAGSAAAAAYSEQPQTQTQAQQDHEAAKSAMKDFEQEQQHQGQAEALFELPYTSAATASLRPH